MSQVNQMKTPQADRRVTGSESDQKESQRSEPWPSSKQQSEL